MPKQTDLPKLKKNSLRKVELSKLRFQLFEVTVRSKDYLLLRWVAAMSLIELHAIWERYAELRLIVALNHNPTHFISENGIKGIKSIPRGLSQVLTRGNKDYFDFRTIADLISQGNRLVGKNKNPFAFLKGTDDLKYLDTLNAIRNRIAHASEKSLRDYKEKVKGSFGMKYIPEPDEFLNALDLRRHSPVYGRKRLFVLHEIVSKAIRNS
ncbi:hypothetical protein [Chryseolinea soli]|uniref:RiboL-PSP-HEPN domain-containing protein n=1 Tax=Chryseolinea soli TaxID=2321403 RepID=A0A385SV11_9BACT|nr:hypothetical protein [Chryseolinea soli]AYB34754.1 hypothetical protein D4L85_31075 [Chryseolinea soli]